MARRLQFAAGFVSGLVERAWPWLGSRIVPQLMDVEFAAGYVRANGVVLRSVDGKTVFGINRR